MSKKQHVKPQEKAKKPGIKPAPSKPSPLLEIARKYGIWISCCALLFMLLAVFRNYIFGDRLLLFKDIGTDTVNFNWPSYYHYSEYLHQTGIPKWSFAQGMGQNLFPAYLGDVPNLLIYLIAPENIPHMLVYVQILKIFLAGLFFYLFLRKINISAYVAVLGAAFYSFSGFMIIGSTWFIFTTEALYLVLLLYGLECLRKDNNFIILPLAVALIGAYNPVYLYLDALLVAAYIICTAAISGFGRPVLNFSMKVALTAVLGAGMASFLLLGSLNQMKESPRGSGNVSLSQRLSSQPMFKTKTSDFYGTFFLRMTGNDMAGYAGDLKNRMFKGWGNYLEAPMQYCGLLSLLLLPQLFAFGKRKTKIVAAIALGIAFFSVLLPYFRHAFWLFTGDYFRTFSLFFIVMQLLLALKALDLILKNQKVNITLLLGAAFFVLLIIFVPGAANRDLRIPVVIFLLIETALVWMLGTCTGRIALTILPVIVVAELIFMSSGAVNERITVNKNDLQRRNGYNDYTREAMDYLRSIDKGFYRIHRNYVNDLITGDFGVNDALVQHYYSTASYHPFNQKNYVSFLQDVKLISDSDERSTRWLMGLTNRLFLSQLVSSKYLLVRENTGPLMSDEGAERMYSPLYDSIQALNGIKIFRNRLFLPLGFTYSSFITKADLKNANTSELKSQLIQDFALLKAAIVEDSVVKNSIGLNRLFMNEVPPFNFDALNTALNVLRTDTLQITSFSDNRITGTINLQQPKLLFFSIPFDKGWKAVIDGKETPALLLNYGFLGYRLPTGSHNVELTYVPLYYAAGMKISIISIFIFIGLIIATVVIKLRKK